MNDLGEEALSELKSAIRYRIIGKVFRANTESHQKSFHLTLFDFKAMAKFAEQKMDRFDTTIFELPYI